MFVPKQWKPHPSHKMTVWRSTVVTLIETSRFGRLRKCKGCDAEHAESVSGQAAHEELAQPCCVENAERHPNRA